MITCKNSSEDGRGRRSSGNEPERGQFVQAAEEIREILVGELAVAECED